MDALHQRVAGRIRTIAEERGLPLSHVPDRAGVTRSHFWRVLDGRASPTLAWLQKVAQALDVDAEEFLVRTRPKRRR